MLRSIKKLLSTPTRLGKSRIGRLESLLLHLPSKKVVSVGIDAYGEGSIIMLSPEDVINPDRTGGEEILLPEDTDIYGAIGKEAQREVLLEHGGRICDLRKLFGFVLVTPQGSIGTVEDFAVDIATWKVKYIIGDTHDMFPEENLPVPAGFLERIDKYNSYLFLNKNIEDIRKLD